MPGIVAHALPAADHVGAVLFQGTQEARNLGRVILQIGIEGQDDLAARGMKASRQRRRLAEIAAETNTVDPAIFPGQLGDDLPRTIGAAVVDEDNLDGEIRLMSHRSDLLVERQKAVVFVVNGDDDRDHDQEIEN